MMRRVTIVVLAFCAVSMFAARAGHAQETNAADLFAKVGKAYAALQECRMDIVMGVAMMGSNMEMTGVLLKKDKKMRMEMEIPMPGNGQKMTTTMVMDGAKITTYQPLTQAAYVIDISKLPAELQQRMQQQSSPMASGVEMIKELTASGIMPTVKALSRNGRDYQVVQIDDISKLRTATGMGQNNFVKKMWLWVNPSSSYVDRIEFYSPTDVLAMWMDFKGIKAQTIPDDTFVLKLPDGVKVVDMTDAVIKMSAPHASDAAAVETKQR
jgi:outer membrane lipoprotein-sorting protein